MSYKDYSEEAVKEILKKVRQSRIEEHNSGTKNILESDSQNTHTESEFDSGIIQQKDYEYNHPPTAEINRMNETHILIEKWFESELPEETIWNEIQGMLKSYFTVESISGEVKKSSSGKRWIYINHSNHETVVRLKKTGRFASLKLIQRVGFWKPLVEGLLHSSYISLILFGVIYGIFEPSLELNIGILTLLWTLAAFIIYRFSVSLRKKKQERLTNFADKITSQFTLHSYSNSL